MIVHFTIFNLKIANFRYYFSKMAKIQQQNGVVPGGGGGTGVDDFSDDDSTPLTQDYAGR